MLSCQKGDFPLQAVQFAHLFRLPFLSSITTLLPNGEAQAGPSLVTEHGVLLKLRLDACSISLALAVDLLASASANAGSFDSVCKHELQVEIYPV